MSAICCLRVNVNKIRAESNTVSVVRETLVSCLSFGDTEANGEYQNLPSLPQAEGKGEGGRDRGVATLGDTFSLPTIRRPVTPTFQSPWEPGWKTGVTSFPCGSRAQCASSCSENSHPSPLPLGGGEPSAGPFEVVSRLPFRPAYAHSKESRAIPNLNESGRMRGNARIERVKVPTRTHSLRTPKLSAANTQLQMVGEMGLPPASRFADSRSAARS